jgi:hypothetical protein
MFFSPFLRSSQSFNYTEYQQNLGIIKGFLVHAATEV